MKAMKRLEALYHFIEPGLPLWDLGCDHGLLGIRALKEERVPIAYFVDSARSATDRLEKVIPESLRARSHILKEDAAELDWTRVSGTVVMAGLGTRTIAGLAAKIPVESRNAIKLVVSPEKGDLKRALEKDGWQIEEQVVSRQGPRTRNVLVARHSSC